MLTLNIFHSICIIDIETSNKRGANMDNNKTEKQSHSVRPYVDSQWEDWTMYNNIPYHFDEDLYHDKKIQLYSGNIIKHQRCQMIDTLELKYQ